VAGRPTTAARRFGHRSLALRAVLNQAAQGIRINAVTAAETDQRRGDAWLMRFPHAAKLNRLAFPANIFSIIIRRMLGLSDHQLGTVIDIARTLPVEKRDLYLQRIAAMLTQRGYGHFTDGDVSDVAKLALTGLAHQPAA
jgi:hypothetical protein